MNGTGGKYVAYLVSSDALRSENVLLPGIIHACLKQSAQPYADPAGGMVVWETLMLLEQPKIEFADMLGNIRRVMNIKVISVVERTPENILIRGDFVDSTPVEIEGVSVDLVTECHPTYHFAKRADLEERYPGWAECWRIGHEIGLELPELVKYAFIGQSETVYSPELPGVTFD